MVGLPRLLGQQKHLLRQDKVEIAEAKSGAFVSAPTENEQKVEQSTTNKDKSSRQGKMNEDGGKSSYGRQYTDQVKKIFPISHFASR